MTKFIFAAFILTVLSPLGLAPVPTGTAAPPAITTQPLQPVACNPNVRRCS